MPLQPYALPGTKKTGDSFCNTVSETCQIRELTLTTLVNQEKGNFSMYLQFINVGTPKRLQTVHAVVSMM